jgi:hypothetical protein
LNSRCSRRLCARLARNRVNIVASSPSAVCRTCASGSIVLLGDSAAGPGQLAVIATPSRVRPTQNATGRSASIPQAAFSIVRSFPRVLTGGVGAVHLDLAETIKTPPQTPQQRSPHSGLRSP